MMVAIVIAIVIVMTILTLIRLTSHRLKRYTTTNEQYRINKIFSSTLGRVYQELSEKPKTGAVPEKGQCEQSWKVI